MALPATREYNRAILALMSDEEVRTRINIVAQVAERFDLNEADKRVLTRSGKALKYDADIRYAISNLYKAELLQRPEHGRYIITGKGKRLLSDRPGAIDRRSLGQLADPNGGSGRKPEAEGQGPQTQLPIASIPKQERHLDLADSVERHNDTVKAQLLSEIRGIPPGLAEQLVLKLLVAMDYAGPNGKPEHTGGPGDGGVDGIVYQDELGVSKILVQVKRYAAQNRVAPAEVLAFKGTMDARQCDKGVFVTTSDFSAEARKTADQGSMRPVLINGEYLADLMLKHKVGVSVRPLELFRIDREALRG